jgi:hypothetical protein
MKLINNNLLILTYAKNKLEHCYDAYNACIWLKNNWQQKRIFDMIFYAMNKNDKFDIIMRLSKLKKMRVKLNYAVMIWRYDFVKNVFQIASTKEFANEMQKH